MIRAMMDTNAVVSSLLSPVGNEALIPLAIQQGLVRPSFSEEILEEYAFAFPAEEIAALLALFRRQGELIVRRLQGRSRSIRATLNSCSVPRQRRRITSSLATSGISRKQATA